MAGFDASGAVVDELAGSDLSTDSAGSGGVGGVSMYLLLMKARKATKIEDILIIRDVKKCASDRFVEFLESSVWSLVTETTLKNLRFTLAQKSLEYVFVK